MQFGKRVPGMGPKPEDQLESQFPIPAKARAMPADNRSSRELKARDNPSKCMPERRD
jgi:hypothetical protein